MKKLLLKPSNTVWRWIRCLVRRSDPWTYGTFKSLKARKHRNGKMEIWSERTNPDHSLWFEAHHDHWDKFQANAKHTREP